MILESHGPLYQYLCAFFKDIKRKNKKKGTPRFVQRFGHFILSYIRKMNFQLSKYVRGEKLRLSNHGDCCTNVEETMIDDITDIGVNDDTQDEELLFGNMMQMPMQDDSQHVDKEKDEETEEEEEEEEHATQIHTEARHTKKQ